MKRSIWIIGGLGLAVLAVGLWFLPDGNIQPVEKSAPPAPSMPLLPGERLRDDWPPEEVFRRAFWRHPVAADKIVRAVRFESAGNEGVSRWAWFLKIHPSPGLLRDLRDPATFGLMPINKPRSILSKDMSAPDWYPTPNGDSEVEILQHPSLPLTLIYHSKENLLYASDHGKGFAKGLPE